MAIATAGEVLVGSVVSVAAGVLVGGAGVAVGGKVGCGGNTASRLALSQ